MASAALTRNDADRTNVTRHHPRSAAEPISYTISEALAAANGVEVTDLEVCLADHIAVDALDTMFEQATGPASTWSMSFTVADYTVQVDGTGEITVTDDQ